MILETGFMMYYEVSCPSLWPWLLKKPEEIVWYCEIESNCSVLNDSAGTLVLSQC